MVWKFHIKIASLFMLHLFSGNILCFKSVLQTLVSEKRSTDGPAVAHLYVLSFLDRNVSDLVRDRKDQKDVVVLSDVLYYSLPVLMVF